MSDIVVRPFRRTDRDQLTALVNAHVRAVVPGVSVSVSTLLAALEREPAEFVLDPWVTSRSTVVAERDRRLVAATQLHRYGAGPEVGGWYRDAAELRWLVCRPEDPDAGAAALDAALRVADDAGARVVHADGSLPAPGCHGIPEVWPHVAAVLRGRGFRPTREETLHLARTAALAALGAAPEGTTLHRSVGECGTRLTAVRDGGSIGYVDVDVLGDDGARLLRSGGWGDIGNLEVLPANRRQGVATWLLGRAAAWLRLGDVERVLAYTEPGEAALLALLGSVGFEPLTRTACGWTRQRDAP